ncbi:FXYD domain-containing ion transport regulator [Pimephales promelas]|nr:FXYD domain-containing ion transport regulator [Pimephales promelas]
MLGMEAEGYNHIVMMKTLALVFLTLFSLVLAEGQKTTEEDPFTFDYHRLRVGGLILAAVLCLIGITILLRGGQEVTLKRCSMTQQGPANAKNPLT